MESDSRMLDSEIMMTHYSAELIFSDEAREQFVQPDLSPIPDHERRDSEASGSTQRAPPNDAR